MIFVIGILTFLLVLNCLLLILLVLMQLPKKDAGGAGVAFGGGAADALFGAGSGNILTQTTKWATVVFFVLALVLGYLQNRMHGGAASQFEQQIQRQPAPSQPAPLGAPTPQPTPVKAPAAGTNATTNFLAVPLTPAGNAPSNAPQK
ncbi:MAG: preprotein translocase subunit SecG [Verrucomicrobiota bacterium]|nr:preprotein translocase subunit SecG [Verrucomicrobiota bacterium]